ncbi:MAG: tRNA pseudouridine(38-40) synthase TruA [Acidobacteria bacterium RIFCSPLOWO2_12_FULL_67_14b]|nr:MAG: tRNA pseudouridine(38-40) synthase TruA [Acidobacteria bacterium RIFCSPLOWO2_12_FULL_67_14b]
MPPRTLKVTIAYDGSAYAGWQRQANAQSIQAVIEDEIAVIVGAHNPLVAAGRTDSGVHAAAQVASITIDHPIPCDELLRALNARLKAGDIRIRSIEDTFDRFDARIYAKTKTYRYAIWNGPAPSPFLRHVMWHVPAALDLDGMAAAAKALVGEHDFAAFQGRGSDVKTTVRRLISVELREVDINTDQPVALPPLPTDPSRASGRLLRLEVTGTGFLRHMVRTIAGTLVDIGRGQMQVGDMAAIVASRDRARAGQTAPPHGLMLWTVTY